MHFYDVIQKTGHLKSIEGIVRDEATAEMDALVARLRKENNAVQVTGHVLKGTPADATNRVATTQGADLVIMGTQGETGALEVFMGSTAHAMIRKSNTATLVIPRSVSFSPPEKVVLAIDEDPYDPNALKPLVALVKAFGSHLYLLHVDSDEESVSYPEELAAALDDITFSYHSRLGSDLSTSINLFAEEVDAQMIGMVRRNKNFFQKIFSGSHTKKELFETQLPLLVLME